MAVTIGNSAQQYAMRDFPQRKLFYANGRHWVFWGDGSGTGTSIRFVSSTDGSSWTGESGVPEASIYLGRSYMFSVWSDDTYVYIIWTHSSIGIVGIIKYKRGLLNADGTITWDGVETVDADTSRFRPSICKASDGKIWAVYADRDSTEVLYNVRNGSWGAPTQLKNTSGITYQGVIPFSSGGQVYIVYCESGVETLYGYLWNGASMSGRQTVSTDTLTSLGWWSLSIDGNDYVHICYRIGVDGSGSIRHVKRTTNWQAPVTVHDGGLTSVKPFICASPSSSYVYCFWHISNTFYYKRYDGSNWDALATTLDTDANVQNTNFNCFWWVENSLIGVCWNRGTETPYDVRYITLDAPDPAAPSSEILMDGFIFVG